MFNLNFDPPLFLGNWVFDDWGDDWEDGALTKLQHAATTLPHRLI